MSIYKDIGIAVGIAAWCGTAGFLCIIAANAGISGFWYSGSALVAGSMFACIYGPLSLLLAVFLYAVITDMYTATRRGDK